MDVPWSNNVGSSEQGADLNCASQMAEDEFQSSVVYFAWVGHYNSQCLGFPSVTGSSLWICLDGLLFLLLRLVLLPLSFRRYICESHKHILIVKVICLLYPQEGSPVTPACSL